MPSAIWGLDLTIDVQDVVWKARFSHERKTGRWMEGSGWLLLSHGVGKKS